MITYRKIRKGCYSFTHRGLTCYVEQSDADGPPDVQGMWFGSYPGTAHTERTEYRWTRAAAVKVVLATLDSEA
jgi:hypothetical protein